MLILKFLFLFSSKIVVSILSVFFSLAVPQTYDVTILNERIRNVGLKVVNVPPDGDCLFASIAHQLGRQGQAASIRDELVSKLKADSKLVCKF